MRFKLILICFLLVLLGEFALVFASDIYITSVMPYTSDDTNNEYIELTNFSGNSISLSGYSLQDKSGKIYMYTGFYLESNSSFKFYRPQTKILLNNTDEEIWLFDTTSIILDNFAYTNSNLNVAIDTLHKPLEIPVFTEINDGTGAEINTDIQDGTGAEINTNIQDSELSFTSTGQLLVSSGAIYIKNITYVGSGQIDINWDDGENYFSGNISDGAYIFTGAEIGSEYFYIINLVNDSGNIIDSFSGSFLFYPENTENISDNLSDSDETLSDSQIISESGAVKNEMPQIIISFQQPTYISYLTGSIDEYICDKSKSECKANFNLISSFTGTFKEGNYGCRVIYNSGIISESCNPDTITFSSGSTTVKFEIYEKSNQTNIVERDILIRNEISISNPIVPQTSIATSSYTVPNYISSISTSSVSLQADAIIRFQGVIGSKILETKKISCFNVDECSINFTGENSINAKYYSWDFGNSITSIKSNPASIKFKTGTYKVTLNVSNDYGFTDFDYFEVYVSGKNDNSTKIKQNNTEFISETGGLLVGDFGQDQVGFIIPTYDEIESGSTINELTVNNDTINAINKYNIMLQGKIGDNLYRKGDIIYCKTSKETCQVNLTLDGKQTKGIKYIWDFGNKSTSSDFNPKSVDYKIGKYVINLKIISENSGYLRNVILGVNVSEIPKTSSKKTSATKTQNKSSTTTKTSKTKDESNTKFSKTENDNKNINTSNESDDVQKTVSMALGFSGFIGVLGFFAKKYISI